MGHLHDGLPGRWGDGMVPFGQILKPYLLNIKKKYAKIF
jgi:hypothetical protein